MWHVFNNLKLGALILGLNPSVGVMRAVEVNLISLDMCDYMSICVCFKVLQHSVFSVQRVERYWYLGMVSLCLSLHFSVYVSLPLSLSLAVFLRLSKITQQSHREAGEPGWKTCTV